MFTLWPTASPSRMENSSSGSQASVVMTMIRRHNNVNASFDRCARRSNWNSGPPRTTEKFDESCNKPWPVAETFVAAFAIFW